MKNKTNIQTEAGTKVLASFFLWIVEQDEVVEWALLRLFHQLLQPYSTVRKWDDEIEF
ncbi:hypothetical protein I872_03990 [Streptococcus cristatus AS 1.3089]|uniref:Uncharacterized protein n=1 Tax=Streptococcus cristatus AS 1.3089 TaxID=1302863 RepID=A0ABN4B483_STRCR|nr:hypothetical protein I872_03990 [Streptococcus cristatus AS 1.3089]